MNCDPDRGGYRLSYRLDIYITIHTAENYSYEVAMKIILCLGSPQLEELLKVAALGRFEEHCFMS